MKCAMYENAMSSQWDQFVLSQSLNGTFLHTRKFLSYHGNRFVDRSYVIVGENKKIIAVFPAAESLTDSSVIMSHPGITYGGLVVGDRCRGETCVNVLEKLMEHYVAGGYRKLVYKVTPNIYHTKLFQDDLYALFRVGANRWRCDLSATIDLENRGKLTKGRKYEINKASKQTFEIFEGRELIDEIHKMLEGNLKRKHDAKPVHSCEELEVIANRFPDRVKFKVVKDALGVLAGIVLFCDTNVVHTQYIASEARAHEFGALDFLIENAINDAAKKGFKYFDFGTNNEHDGLFLNENLYRYKRSFGSGSMVHEFYEIGLEGA